MAEDHKAGSPFRSRNPSAPPKRNARENDTALLALQARFDAIATELGRAVARHREDVDREALTKEIEATLARLDPIERAIMETPAGTIVGLAVKARHAAYTLSEYWEAP